MRGGGRSCMAQKRHTASNKMQAHYLSICWNSSLDGVYHKCNRFNYYPLAVSVKYHEFMFVYDLDCCYITAVSG